MKENKCESEKLCNVEVKILRDIFVKKRLFIIGNNLA